MRKHRSTRFGRRTALGLLGAGLAAPFIRPAARASRRGPS